MLKVTLLCISMGAIGATILGTRPVLRRVDDNDSRVSDLTVSAGSADRLDVNIPLGDVTVIADNSRDLTVHLIRSAKKPIDNEARKWLDDSFLKAENRGGVLTVRDHPFGKDSLNNIDDHHSNRNGKSLDLKVQIHVPSSLAAKLEFAFGVADIHGRFRSLDARMGAGVLTTGSVTCSGKMDIHVGAGEVNLNIPSGANEDVSAAVGVGEITGLPGNAKRKEGIHLGDSRRGHTGQGDSKVEVHVGAGSIKVDSKDRILARVISEEPERGEMEADQKSGDIDVNIDDHLGETVQKSLDIAMRAVQASVGKTSDIKLDLGDMKFDHLDDLKELKDLDKLQDLKELKSLDKEIDKDLAKELSKIGPEIEKAMKNFKPDIEKQMKDLKPQIERSMRDMKPDIDKEVMRAMAEVQKAMKTIKPEMEKAMRQMKPEIEKAIREAMKEIDRAMKDLKDNHSSDLD